MNRKNLGISMIFTMFLYIFSFFCSANSGVVASSKRQFVPINISGQFNSNAIYGKGDNWKTDFNYSQSTEQTWRKLGVDGRRVLYTEENATHYGDEDESYCFPNSGMDNIGNVPFEYNANTGNDCIKLNKYLNDTNVNINIGNLKVKNLYMIATCGNLDVGRVSEANVKFFGEDGNAISSYSQTLEVYDWYDTNNIEISKNNSGAILDYKKYNTILMPYTNYSNNGATISCYRLDNFNNESTKFDQTISKINVQFEGKVPDSSQTSRYGYQENACFDIFAITAELEWDEEISISDISYNQFKINFGPGGTTGDIYVSETEGINIRDMETNKSFPYTKSVTEGRHYCTLHNSNTNAYYYFIVDTKKSLKLVLDLPQNLVYNGLPHQMILSSIIKDAKNNIRTDTDLPTVYLRINKSNQTDNPDWKTSENLNNITATDAGTYYVYYYIDNLGDYVDITQQT